MCPTSKTIQIEPSISLNVIICIKINWTKNLLKKLMIDNNLLKVHKKLENDIFYQTWENMWWFWTTL
jgi:hypothetical protein